MNSEIEVSHLRVNDNDNDNVFIGIRVKHDDKWCKKFRKKLVKHLKHSAQKKYDAIAGNEYTY